MLTDLVVEFTKCLEKAIAEKNEEIRAWVTTVTIPY